MKDKKIEVMPMLSNQALKLLFDLFINANSPMSVPIAQIDTAKEISDWIKFCLEQRAEKTKSG